MAHQHKEASNNDGDIYGSSAVTSTPPCLSKSKVATTTRKMSILLNQSEDIKVGHFGIIEFVDRQRAHCETFVKVSTIYFDNPTNQNKIMAEKEQYSFSDVCMLNIFIHIFGIFYVGTVNVDYSRSTQEVCQAITNLKQEQNRVDRKAVALT